MPINFDWISYGMPIFSVVLVFVLAYAMLAKTKVLGGSKWINVIIALMLSLIFLSFSSVQAFLGNITPWFILTFTLLFFFFMIIAFMIKDPSSFAKPFTIVFIVVFALIIIITFFYSFPSTQAYLPGADEGSADNAIISIKHFILSSKVLNGILLFVIFLIVALIIVR